MELTQLTPVLLELIKHDAGQLVGSVITLYVVYTKMITPLVATMDKIHDALVDHKTATGERFHQLEMQVNTLGHKIDLSQHTRQQNNVPY